MAIIYVALVNLWQYALAVENASWVKCNIDHCPNTSATVGKKRVRTLLWKSPWARCVVTATFLVLRAPLHGLSFCWRLLTTKQYFHPLLCGRTRFYNFTLKGWGKAGLLEANKMASVLVYTANRLWKLYSAGWTHSDCSHRIVWKRRHITKIYS